MSTSNSSPARAEISDFSSPDVPAAEVLDESILDSSGSSEVDPLVETMNKLKVTNLEQENHRKGVEAV